MISPGGNHQNKLVNSCIQSKQQKAHSTVSTLYSDQLTRSSTPPKPLGFPLSPASELLPIEAMAMKGRVRDRGSSPKDPARDT